MSSTVGVGSVPATSSSPQMQVKDALIRGYYKATHVVVEKLILMSNFKFRNRPASQDKLTA